MGESKLIAIDRALNTWERTIPCGNFKQISRRCAMKLCLERGVLKRWIRIRRDIEDQKKGTQRNRRVDETTGRELVMEMELNR
jgi:hypothetical protein